VAVDLYNTLCYTCSMKICKHKNCENEVVGPAFKLFCDPKCGNKHHVQNRRVRLKQKALKYAGGKCILCGYSKSSRALVFHHRDESQKSFGIAERGLTRGWERVRSEIDKCDLLCMNCHMEVHEELLIK